MPHCSLVIILPRPPFDDIRAVVDSNGSSISLEKKSTKFGNFQTCSRLCVGNKLPRLATSSKGAISISLGLSGIMWKLNLGQDHFWKPSEIVSDKPVRGGEQAVFWRGDLVLNPNRGH